MVFVDNIADLEFYSPNPQWGCYGDTVFAPYDILLQANGFTATGYTIVINVCSPNGTILEDATASFDSELISFIISGTTYYAVNIRCDDFSTFMLSNNCFVLEIIITDTGTGLEVFHKWTQKYQLASTAAVFVPVVIMDGQPLVNCIPGASSSNCNRSYIKFKSTFDCVDSFTGDFYGTGTLVSGLGNFPFNFERFSWIEGKFRKVPNEIKRTISINCRTQRTDTTPKYLLTGNSTFPVWKVEEIERQMLANHLFVDDVEYQSEGGTIFEQFGRPFNCQYVYKLTIHLQTCFEWQIFGCVPTCDDLATFYGFRAAFSRLYDDKQQLIATTPAELEIYFESQIGFKSVQQLPFILPCPIDSLFKVQSSGVLPKFIYVDNIIPGNRVFPKQLPVTTLDFTPLCNGITNYNQVPQAEVTGYLSETITIPIAEVTGYESQNANSYILSIIPASNNWTLDNNITSAANYQGEVTLNISATTNTVSSPYVNERIAAISGNGKPLGAVTIYGTDNPNLLPGSMVVIDTNGGMYYTGDRTSVQQNDSFVEFFQLKYNING